MPSTQISFTLLAFMLRAQDFADLRARRKVLGTIAYTLRVKRLLRSARAQQVASNVALGLKPQARVPTGYSEQGCCLKGLIRVCICWLDEKSLSSTDVVFSTVRRPSPCQ